MSEPPASTLSAAPGQDTEARVMLADAIERRGRDIEQRWLERVQQDVAATGRQIPPTDLRDSIGEYLVRLAEALRGAESIESGGSAAWAEIAREHALTRVRLGFDIDELVHEFIVLRRILFEVAREEGVGADGLQSDRLADLIGAAVATAVKSYVESHVHVVVDDHPSEALVHVYDSWEGLAPEAASTIFEPFKRRHSGKAGTGLGLAIARRAVEAQGGRIGVDSTVEHGCHFWLTFPKPNH